MDSEDFELVDLLQNLDEKPVEEDSIMGVPANVENEADVELDNAEYSQIFNEDTLIFSQDKQ